MDQMQGAAILLTGIFVGMAISQMDLGARSPKRDEKTGRPVPFDMNDFEFEVSSPTDIPTLDSNFVAMPPNLDFGPHPHI